MTMFFSRSVSLIARSNLINSQQLLSGSLKLTQSFYSTQTTSNMLEEKVVPVKMSSSVPETQVLDEFFSKVNQIIDSTPNQRNFAVVHIYSKQKLVKEGDMFYVYKNMPAKNGDRIKLEKVLLAGNENISLVGRPLLDRNLVHVEVTVIEKTHSHTFMGMKHTPRSHGYRRYYFQRKPLTILRVNEIKICHHLNETHSVVQ